MARKSTGKQPKIQRGLSLDPELHQAIAADAERLGKTWNEIAESIIRKAFSAPKNLHVTHVNSHGEGDSGEGIFE